MSRLWLAILSGSVVIAATWLAPATQNPAGTVVSVPALRAFGPLQPRLSPDGQKIVFSCQGSIWVMPAGGGTMTRLTHAPGFDTEPAWSADGQQIAYLNGRSFGAGRIRVIGADDGKLWKAFDQIQANGKLAFHPDGRRLLASLQSPDLPGGERLAWLDLSTGKITAITDAAAPVHRAALSANGQWIAWATNRDVAGQQGGNDGPESDLWKVAATGGKPEKCGSFSARIYDLCWSADGNNLFISTDLGGAHNDLWQLPLSDIQHGRKLTFGQADEDRPSVAHHGHRLLYNDNREGATSLVLRDLRTGAEETLAVNAVDYRQPAGRLHLRLVDKSTGKPAVGRVHLTDQQGAFYAPLLSLYRIDRGNGHFYCNGSAEWHVPAGEYQVRVQRGLQYIPSRQKVRIEPGQEAKLTIELERWIDAASMNLYSGENHIHANYGYGEWYNTPESMRLQCEGEDLNVCNFMVANSDGDGVFDREFFRGRPDSLSGPHTILYWNEEYRSTIWGHMTLVNLRHVVEPVFTGFKGTTNPYDVPTNTDTADRTHLQSGLVNYTHIAFDTNDLYQGAYTGKGLPVDAVLGKIDSVDINLSYAGSVALWYRLLNCGFRLPASAGTDCFLNRAASRLPGSDRAYVRIEDGFSYDKWIAGLRAGRTLVTNGPFLDLKAGQAAPGGSVRLAAPGKILVSSKAWSNLPLRRAELIQDGQVIAGRDFAPGGKQETHWQQEVTFEHSGWLALRATGPYHEDNSGGASYAHTSPIYVVVEGHPHPARDDAQFFLKWIDRLELALRERDRLPDAASKAHALEQLNAARRIYAAIASR
jgi:hypothetical protein